jgi:hypothetical protein
MMLLVGVVEGAGARTGDCPDARAFAASRDSADGSPTGRACTDPFRRIHVALMPDILAIRAVMFYGKTRRRRSKEKSNR